METLKGRARIALIAALAAAAIDTVAHAQAPAGASPVDPYPGAMTLSTNMIATIMQAPAINSRTGPGATPRGVAFPVAGQLLQGNRYRATQSSDPTRSPACSRGWVQLVALEPGQNVVGGNRDVWICKGDGAVTYAVVAPGQPDTATTTGAAPPTPPRLTAPPGSVSPTPQQSAAPPGSAPSAPPQSAAAPGVVSGPTAAASATPASPAPVPPAPVPPAAIVVSPTGPTSITLNWNPATPVPGSRIGGYRVERCGGQSCRNFREIATPAAPPFADSGLNPGVAYAYRIRAYDSAGRHSDYTSVALATTLPPVASQPDLVISELKAPATAVIGAQINVSAMASNKGATATGRYRLAFYFSNDQSATTFSGTYCEMAELAPGATWPCSGTVAAPPTLAAGTYWLVAYADDLNHVPEKDENNNTGAVRIALTAAVAQPAPASLLANPTGLQASVAGPSSIRLNWVQGAVAGAIPTGYKIERCAGNGCTSFTQIATSAFATHVDPGLAAGTRYTYRIRAYDSVGNGSNYSNPAFATTPPPAAGVIGGQSNSQ